VGASFRTALVLNPRSGGQRGDRARREIVRTFHEMFPGCEARETRQAGDAEGIVRSFLEEGYECVAVGGGDGTFNEAVNGYFRPVPAGAGMDPAGPAPVARGACLAILPIGTGGDFRRSLGLEPDPIAAMSLLSGKSSRAVDVGHAEYTDPDGRPASRFFLNVTSFGLGGLVDEHVNRSRRKLPGSLAFFAATVRAFVEYDNVRVRVLVDRSEQKVERAAVVAVANGRFFGGGMEVAPVARIEDGLLDVVIMGDLGLRDFIFHAGKIYGGRILDHPLVQHRPAREVVIDCVEEGEVMLMDMDGEPLGRLPASLRVCPGALRIKT